MNLTRRLRITAWVARRLGLATTTSTSNVLVVASPDLDHTVFEATFYTKGRGDAGYGFCTEKPLPDRRITCPEA